MRVEFYREAQAALLVFDVNNRGSFEALPGWLAEAQSAGAPPDWALFVAGTKSDVQGGQRVAEAEARAWAAAQGAQYFEASSRNGHEPFPCRAFSAAADPGPFLWALLGPSPPPPSPLGMYHSAHDCCCCHHHHAGVCSQWSGGGAAVPLSVCCHACCTSMCRRGTRCSRRQCSCRCTCSRRHAAGLEWSSTAVMPRPAAPCWPNPTGDGGVRVDEVHMPNSASSEGQLSPRLCLPAGTDHINVTCRLLIHLL